MKTALTPTLGTALGALATALFAPVGAEVSLPWLFLGCRVGLDETGRLFLLFTAALWLAAAVFARSYLAADARRGRFFAFFFAAMLGNFALIVARDAVTFYVGFSLMSLASYGLVIHDGRGASLRAGRVYLALAVLGELLVFAGIALQCAAAGSLLLREVAAHPMHGATLALLLAGFGIKAGALPLHVWLPLAHPAAPAPASAVLSGAMVKSGLLGWMLFLPLGHEAHPGAGASVFALGLAAAFYGALVGITQRNPKAVLAYSTISQMGLIALPIGAALMQPALWPAALVVAWIFALHHALAKGALFLGAGLATHAASHASRACLFVGLALPALSLVGAPFTSGAIAKAALKSDLAGALPPPWLDVLAFCFPIAAVGTTLLMARFLWLLWKMPAAHEGSSAGLWLPWLALLVAVAVAVWTLPFADPAQRAAFALPKIIGGLWPLAAGLLLATAAALRGPRLPRIPSGDWIIPLLLMRCRRRRPRLDPQPATSQAPSVAYSTLDPVFARAESALVRWPVAGCTLLALAAIIYLLTRW
jgi:formate hydrogenlyase subunit 3/multisubunit Na+/H+ antiporter MnhD subunit